MITVHLTISSHMQMKDAFRLPMHLATIPSACMMSPPSRRRSFPHCSTSSGRYFLATFGETQNWVARPFVRTLRMESSRGPTRFGATSSYCGSTIVFKFKTKLPRCDLQFSSLFVWEEMYLGGFPSCSSVRLYKSLICQSCDRSIRCWSILAYGFRRLWTLR